MVKDSSIVPGWPLIEGSEVRRRKREPDRLVHEPVSGAGLRRWDAQGSEQCDASGESAVCDADCTAAFCGHGTRNSALGEACDSGGSSPTCDANCTFPVCGDGLVNPNTGEQCDDQHLNNADGCDNTCRVNPQQP